MQPLDSSNNFGIRSSLPVRQAVAEVRAALQSLDPALNIDIKTLNERVKISNARRIFQTALLTGFASVAVALALVGLYGLISYKVKQRTGEIAIHLVLSRRAAE